MKRNLILAMLIIWTIADALHARGFGGSLGRGPGGYGIEGSGELWANSVSGTGGLWGDGAYGAGLPGWENLPGANAAYGGFFDRYPNGGLNKGEAAYHPLAGEPSVGGMQSNVNAQRQAFVSSLAGMGIQTGGFRPGQFGPPPKSMGLPSDIGLHQSVEYHHAQTGTARGLSVVKPAVAGDATRNWSAADLRVQGNFVRSTFRDYNIFGRNWYRQYPGAWYARGFARSVWSATDWADVTGWFGGDWPVYGYMYGSDLTYENNDVYLYGRPIATAAKYYDAAVAIAQAGERANIPSETPVANEQFDPTKAKWLPLGVFEAIPSGAKSSNMIFQLAVNKAGIIRGNYFDTKDKNVQLVEGSVDKDTQRVAWVVADKKGIIFDCALYNLTRAETPVLVHMGKDKNEQWTFVRLQQEPNGTAK